jgi:hypothetical protein
VRLRLAKAAGTVASSARRQVVVWVTPGDPGRSVFRICRGVILDVESQLTACRDPLACDPRLRLQSAGLKKPATTPNPPRRRDWWHRSLSNHSCDAAAVGSGSASRRQTLQRWLSRQAWMGSAPGWFSCRGSGSGPELKSWLSRPAGLVAAAGVGSAAGVGLAAVCRAGRSSKHTGWLLVLAQLQSNYSSQGRS